MLISSYYLRPNITIEIERVNSTIFFVYNYQGIHYRLFNSLDDLKCFLMTGKDTWIYDCLTESEMEKYQKNLANSKPKNQSSSANSDRLFIQSMAKAMALADPMIKEDGWVM